MVIHYALMSSDKNPLYIDFIPIITKAWKKMGVIPVYIVIGSQEIKPHLLEDGSIYAEFAQIPDIKLNFQALNARIWAWKMLSKETNAILTDIDMMPLSKEYFCGTASKYEEHQVISYCNDAIEKFGQIAACYILGNCGIMSSLIKESSWEDFIRARAEETGQGWGGDQFYLGEILHGCGNYPPDPNKMVHNKPYEHAISLTRGFNSAGEAFNRLDRINWKYNPYQVGTKLYDAHCLRPYLQHKDEIDKLYNLIPA